MSKRTRVLFRASRLSADADAVISLQPVKVARRVKNKAVGRVLGKVGFWRRLWGG